MDSGDESNEAFSAFYYEFTPSLVRFLLWRGASLAEAADVAQETMCKVYLGWARIERPEPWARTVAVRELWCRTAHNRESPVAELPDGSPLLSTASGTQVWEERQQVLQILALLPARQRQVLAYHYDGYSPAQTATELGITAEAVRGSLAKARRSVAAHLAQESVHPDARTAETRRYQT